MNIIIIFVFWLIGIGIGSFTLLSILIILFFSIPITKKLEKIKALKENSGIIKRYLVSLFILSIIFLVAVIITFLFIPSGIVGLLIGMGMVLVFGLGKIGKNPNNISDYVQVNSRHFVFGLEETISIITQL